MASRRRCDLALDDEIFVGAQVDAMLLSEALGAGPDEVNVRALGENFSGHADGIADVLHAADAAGAQSGAVHHQSVELHPAVHVEEGAAAGVEGLVLLHGDHRSFDRVEATASALQQLPALGGSSLHAAKMVLDGIVGDRPGSAMDQQYRIDRQV